MTGPRDYRSSLERARSQIRAHGRAATCWQILHPDVSLWFPAASDGVVGFVTYRRVRVVAGEPVCAPNRLPKVCREFEHDAALAGERVCYLAAERPMIDRLGKSDQYSVVPIGAQPVWDPLRLKSTVKTNASLRHQVNRARNKGLIVAEWPTAGRDYSVLRPCLHRWLAQKPLPALGFMTDPYLLDRLQIRRLWIAERNGVPVGFTVLSPVPVRKGWLVEQIVRCDQAPNGTAESLVAAAAQGVAADGSKFMTLGTAPLSRRGWRLTSEDPLWLRALTGWMRAHGTRFYNFRGLEHFKAKFLPQAWEPVFAVTAEPKIRFATLYAVLGAFTGRSPIMTGLIALGSGLTTESKRLLGFS